MPRYANNESDNEYEPKTNRKTRAAAAAAASATDSPMRRSSRIRQSSVNPDGSSPESVTGAAGTQVTRVTRRRAAAAAELQTVPEAPRALRSRKNSVSSNISDQVENESAPGTPRGRSTRRLSIIEPSPGTPKPASKTRQAGRASSETKSPPPAVRVTRRTRATSVEPEPIVELGTKGATALAQSLTSTATPTRRRRTLVSTLPTEPVLTEEASEEQVESNIDELSKKPEESNSEDSPQSAKSSRRSSSGRGKKLRKDDSSKELSDPDIEGDESLESSGKLSEKSSPTEILSAKNGSGDMNEKVSEVLKSPRLIQIEQFAMSANESVKPVQSLAIKTKRQSLDKSKELGMKIEDLLNQSTEEQEKSPGNKENQKLNVSPEKIRKTLEFNVSNVNIARGKSIGSALVVNKSGDKKMNTSLDERVLSKSRYEIAAQKSIDMEDNKVANASQNGLNSSLEKKSQLDSPAVAKTAKENQDEPAPREEEVKNSEGRQSSKTGYTKIDETIVENEVIEEFTLYDSDDSLEDGKTEFSLKVADVDDAEKNNSSKIDAEDGTTYGASKQQLSFTKSKKSTSNQDSESESDADSSSDIFEKRNPTKRNSSKKNGDDTQGKEPETLKPATKQDKKRKSTEKKESDDQNDESKLKSIDSGDGQANNVTIERNSNKDNDMDTNEHEEIQDNEKSLKISPDKRSANKNESMAVGENQSSKSKDSKDASSEYVSDSDSNITFDRLFQNISAEEWNKETKIHTPKEKSPSKQKSSLKGKDLLDADESNTDEDPILTKEKSLKEDAAKVRDNNSSDSEDTVILKKNDSAKKSNKKRKSVGKTIVEEAESGNEEIEETVKNRKSLNKSTKSNTSMENGTNDVAKGKDSGRKSLAKSQEEEEGMEVDDDESEAETISSNIDKPATLQDADSGDDEVEEKKEAVSSKNTPKNMKKKSPAKSATKSKKSQDVYEVNESIESEKNDEVSDEGTDDDDKAIFIAQNKKSLRKQEKRNTSRTPLNRNFSILAQVDSDSGPGDVTDPDCPSPKNSRNLLPNCLFNVQSSGDEIEEDGVGAMEDESNNTMDSDIAKEMNLAGDNDIKYSDDDVPGDECRASESEHSDENDDGSDIDDFVVPDDEVESSESSEEEIPAVQKFGKVLIQLKSRFKRIKDKSSSEEESEGDNEDDKNEENHENANESRQDVKVEHTAEKSESKSRSNVPYLSNDDDDDEYVACKRKKLNFSLESNKSLSAKKIKGKSVDHSEESATPILLSVENDEKSHKKLPKFTKPARLLNETVDLCTPEQSALLQTLDLSGSKSPGLNTSANRKSINKLKKNLVRDLGVSTPEETDTIQKNAEDILKTPKTKTPNKEKKSSRKNTPALTNKSNRESIQLIEEAAAVKSNVSDLNKSMPTPNSETPATKFLKKEKLNESLPLLELKKKGKRMYDENVLSKMNEDEQENIEASETDERKEIAEESNGEESDANSEDIEENDDEVHDNSHRDDNEEDETDEESRKEDESGDEDEENENEAEDEECEESSEDEINLSKKKNSCSKPAEQPETERSTKSKKSTSRKSLSKLEDDVFDTPDNKQSARRQSTNGDVASNKKRNSSNSLLQLPNEKKRARLESSETPRTPKVVKKMRIESKTNTPLQDYEESDSDEAPESLGFGEARTKAVQALKDVADNLKAVKEAKKKKRRDQLERVRQEKEAKAAKKSALQIVTQPKPVKNNLKRLPDEVLDNLSDVPERPKKKRKLSKKEEQIVPSRYMFSPGKQTKSGLKIEEFDSPVSSVGGTTHFSVVNLEKVKKQPKKAAAVASFRELMLARNPRQPVSAFLMYKAKQKASGKQLFPRKQT